MQGKIIDRTSAWLTGRGRRSQVEAAPAEDAERLASYPHPYPDAWYVVARSTDLGKVPLSLRAFGRSLVAFRTSDGRAVVLDAHCPHLGANLGDGVVKGDAIECPFHRWQFGVNGRCAHIPYAERVPQSIGTRAWPVAEHYGLVCVYHAEGLRARGAVAEPPYRLPPIAGIDNGEMVFRGAYDGGVVRMHLVEFAENSADMRHFAPLHGDMFVPWTRFKLPGVSIRHQASWEPDAERGHVAWFRDRAELAFRGRPIPRSGADAAIEFIGPGSVVVFTFEVPGMGLIAMFHTHTPLEPLAQAVRFQWFADRRVPRLLVSYVVGNWISQWREDIRIWERKVYRHKPMLVAEDGPIHALRRWYAQFYPDLRARGDQESAPLAKGTALGS